MNPLFEKYSPSRTKNSNEGKYLLPIFDNNNTKETYEMEEHKTNLYGDIVTSLIVPGFLIYGWIYGMETTGNVIVIYCIIAILLFGSLFLFFNGISKIINSKNKSSLSVNSQRIRHHDSIKSITKNINWTDIEDLVIKFYYRSNGFDSYLLVLNKESKVIGMDITSLHATGKKSIIKDDFKKTLLWKEPEYTELRKILGKHLNSKNNSTITSK